MGFATLNPSYGSWFRRAPSLIPAAFAIGAQRLGVRHGDDVVAGIDEVNFPGHARRKAGEQIKSGAAQIVERDTAMQRRVTLLKGEHRTRITYAGTGECPNRPGRDRIDPDRLAAEIDREITHRR